MPSMEMTTSKLQPTTTSERIVTLDVLRGIALFGVLTANIWLWFSGVNFLFPGVASELQRLSIDSVAFILIAIFVSGKAIRTFSLLFGLGFALQMMRAEAGGRGIASLYSRRLAALMAIGIVHAVVFWYGDILLSYALLGFGLLLFRRRSQRTVLIWAAILIVVAPIAASSIPLIRSLAGGDASLPSPPAEQNQILLTLFASAQPAQVIEGNVLMLRRMYLTPKAIGYANLFGFFLLGFYAGRARLFERPIPSHRQLHRLVWLGLSIGVTFSLVQIGLRMTFGGGQAGPPPTWFPLAIATTAIISTTPFALAYITAAALLLEHSRWRPFLSKFAPVGRMALTNYLSQTLICLAIYYAGGLFGSFRPALGVLIAIGVFGAQMAFSAWWLERFRFGPAEWFWRSLTYGQMQPMQIRKAAAAMPA